MANSDEELNVSEPGTSTAQRRPVNEKKRRSKSNQKQLDSSEKEEVVRMYGNTDEVLEKCAQNHNMTALNVKSVLRNVIKNHRALARVLGTDVEDESGEGVRNTRSRTKAVQDATSHTVDMTSSVRIKKYTFVDLSYNDDDDEFDNDWRPDDEEEEASDSSQVGSSDEESSHLSEMDEEKEENGEELQDLTIVDDGEGASRVDDYQDEFDPQSRPYSAQSQTLNAMMREDDEPSNDPYHEFLNQINGELAYNEEDDPDYTVPAEDVFAEEPDLEIGSYWNTTIPQREVNGLIEDIVPPDRFEELARNLSPPLHQPKVVRPDPIVEKKQTIPTISPNVVDSNDIPDKSVLYGQIRQIRHQMEQHIQLLTQVYVGCYFEPLLQCSKHQAFDMIETLSSLSRSSEILQASSFHYPILSAAAETCNGMAAMTIDPPVQPLKMEELAFPRAILPITKKVLATCKALPFPHLVSRHRMVQSVGNDGWSYNECILFAMALNRYAQYPETHKHPRCTKYNKIATHSMPWRTSNDLRWQYNGMKRGLKRNGKTRHNKQFFNVIEGSPVLNRPCDEINLGGITMDEWPEEMHPPWYALDKMEVKRSGSEELEKEVKDGLKRRKETREEEWKRRKERKIEEGDDEMEPIVIVENEDEEGEVDVERMDEDEEGRREEKDSKGDCVEGGEKENENEKKKDEEGREEVEKARGNSEGEEEDGEMSGQGGGPPTDFSLLFEEMPPSGMRQRAPSPREVVRSTTPYEKTMLPPTPGKRIPTPTDDTIGWMDELEGQGTPRTPPMDRSPLMHSRIMTPGGTWDYVDSLMGYFGTPEREEDGEKEFEPTKEKRSNAYSHLFGDFFDESDTNEGMESPPKKRRIEKEEEEERIEMKMDIDASNGDEPEGDTGSESVKVRKKRYTREEKKRIGIEAITDASFRRRIMCALGRKTAKDIISRMNMHSSVLKQIQHIIVGRVDNEDKEKMFRELLPILSSDHKEVLYLLSVFAPPSSLPRPLVISAARQAYVAAMDIICTIYAYMSTLQRRMSYRMLLKAIMEAYSKGGREGVMNGLEELLVNDGVLLKVLSEYKSPSFPPMNCPQWEMVDLRRGEEAFNIIKDNPVVERIDQCELMGTAPSKRQLITMGKTPSALLPNNDGEPCLRKSDGKYSEIIVESEEQIEEERRSRKMELEEERKARMREKTKERMKIVKKAKMAERREEKAKEKKKEEEKKAEDEEKRKRVDEPTLPFTREVDKALLLMYNEVQRVTKRAARKLAVDIPYSTNFSVEQLQKRLEFLVNLANQDH